METPIEQQHTWCKKRQPLAGNGTVENFHGSKYTRNKRRTSGSGVFFGVSSEAIQKGL
jgi:hypothetical protein